MEKLLQKREHHWGMLMKFEKEERKKLRLLHLKSTFIIEKIEIFYTTIYFTHSFKTGLPTYNKANLKMIKNLFPLVDPVSNGWLTEKFEQS